jgi:S1-C subfamily serine protease
MRLRSFNPKLFLMDGRGAKSAQILAVALFLFSFNAQGQDVTPRAAPRIPVQAPAPTSPATIPRAQAAPVARRAAPHVAAPPRQVVTVVHRLSGWKLLNWLASSGPPALELEDLPSTDDVHTNIVAGYISEDGRTVVARLPRAEVGLQSFPPPLPALFPSNVVKQEDEHEYMVVAADGRRVEAKFVGLDTSTGLSLLEANETLFSEAPTGEEGNTEDPTVGQRVRLYAPAPAAKAAPGAATAPAPEDGYIYLSIDEKEGRLTEVRRAPSGKLFSVVARANVPPEWAGAVAADESGEVVGIVAQSSSGMTQIVPVETIRAARARVLKLRASAPQPWLGARGDAAFRAPIETWVNLGWKPERAMPHIQNRQGVFLTSVAPGTPAALAGLRPGDLIARVGARDVRSVEDLSFSLKEAGVGSSIDFTVWRALEQTPLKLSVQLEGAQNPALATAEAEERAARSSLIALRREADDLKAEELRAEDLAALTVLAQKLLDTEKRLDRVREQVEEAEARIAAARIYTTADPARGPAGFNAATPLQTFGLNAVGLTGRGATRLGASGGLFVVAVRPDSPCAASGLRAGDLIETLNGAPFTRADLARLVSAYEAATPISLGVVREGQRVTIKLSIVGESERQK